MYFSLQTYAGEKDFFNLVSVIVDEDNYDELQSTLVRYSRDVQATLENTRVVIIPTPSDASVLDIASLNESLYFEGYKAHKDVDFESRLIGTVLVGKIPVPVVFDEVTSGKSVLPYVDFEDKAFVYNHENGKYERNELAETRLVPEIWHGIISPNTGSASDDTQAIKDYFDKNHDFYTGRGVFDQAKGVIDGEDTDAPDGYDPYVFYYDQFRENKAIQYQNYIGYQMYLQNMEDITYNRYSKELAEKVKDQILGIQNHDIEDLLIEIDPDFDLSALSTGPDITDSSDVMTRYLTDNATKKFLEIFNGSTLGEMRKHVYNAGRYNEGGSRVNVDMPPFLISVLDQVSAEVVKNVNSSLERQITDLVANGLSRKIAIPVSKTNGGGCDIVDHRAFYYGQMASSITSAEQCSIYRGSTQSGTLVASSRGFNIDLTDEDIALCGSEMRTNSNGVYTGLEGYWGGNSPAGLTLGEGIASYELVESFPKEAIRPIFDIKGSKEVNDSSKIPSPLDCFTEGSMIKTLQKHTEERGEEGDTVCITDLIVPIPGVSHGSRVNWSCQSRNSMSSIQNFTTAFNSMGSGFSSVPDGGVCNNSSLSLDGEVKRSQSQSCSGGGEDGCSCTVVNDNTQYKSISSYILHTSPTDEEFGAQITSLFTPSLPIDKNRYIDFIGARGGPAPDYGYQRIDFPQLFRVIADSPSELTLDAISEKTKQHLDEISNQINQAITDSNPSGLSGNESDLYNILKTGDFPSATVDLYQDLIDKPLEVFTIDNQSKQISYFDTLVFAIYWNNLTTVSSKYKFIFENYLSNQFEGNDYNFHLPRSQKSYETAYLGAPGDPQNMYIKLDPELKAIHPYSDILSKNIEFQGLLLASSVATPVYPEGAFECGPPDGVNIFQWIPAIICWLKNMLPPKIKISQGQCGGADLFTEEEQAEIAECDKDDNKNGINDCIENALGSGSLSLLSDAGRYYYFSPGTLVTQALDSEGDVVKIDSNSYVEYNLEKVEIPLNPDEAFGIENKQVVYDRSVSELSTPEAFEEAQKYISFTNPRIRSQRGETKTYFYGKGQDSDIYFSSSLVINDADGNTAIDLQSNTQKIEIRGERLLINSNVVFQDGFSAVGNTLQVSGSDNICIVDGSQLDLEDAVTEAFSLSDAKEKLLLSLQNYSGAGNLLDVSYPITLELRKDSKQVFLQTDISREDLGSVYPFHIASESGRYEVYVTDANGYKTYRTFDLLPDKASKLDPILSTSVMEVGGNITTHLVTILDQYDNPATGEVYTLNVSIDGDGLVFDDTGTRDVSYNIIEGYKAFRLKSTDNSDTNTISFELRDTGGNLIFESEETIQTIADIQVQLTPIDGIPKVGGAEYRYDVVFTDGSGNTLTNLDSRVYFNIPELYGIHTQSYTEVDSGTAQVSFQTLTLAGRNLTFELQLEGGNEIYTYTTNILPEIPVKIDLQLNRDQIEASPEDSAILQATLKDRYNNEVFTDNSTELDIEIHERSTSFITVDELSKRVSEGIAQFEISGTEIPGIGYFKVISDPDLSENTFELIGQAPFDKSELTISEMKNPDGSLTVLGEDFYTVFSDTKFISKFSTKLRLTSSNAYINLSNSLKTQVENFWDETNSLTVAGIGENAGQIETFFFWDKEDIQGNAYNGIYTVLYGAQYGDITEQDYLAGALLFDRDNSSLGVTSLLNSPYQFYDTFSIEKDGYLSQLSRGDITQDIQFTPRIDGGGRVVIDVNNDALDTYIGSIYYSLSDTNDITLDIEDSIGYTVSEDDEKTTLRDNEGKVLLHVYNSGIIDRKAGLNLEIDFSHAAGGLQLILSDTGNKIGSMNISGDFDINITRDLNLLDIKLDTLESTVIIYLQSSQYSSRKTLIDVDEYVTKIHYHDPFGDSEALNELHNYDIMGLESSLDEEGIGWKDSNTMLLSFSAGDSIGDATKEFHSFSLINLGDPVVSLKALKNTFRTTGEEKSFDSTVGEIISNRSDLIGYQLFDYNNDTRVDLLTVHTSGYIDLYENYDVDGRFKKHSSLVYAADGGSSRLVKAGDFTGDGYGDIFFLTEDGKPTLFNNVEKDFLREDLTEQMSLSGTIIQAEVYDMDNDGIDDITTLDDAGEIHIFYGGGTSTDPQFTKNFIGDGYAISLSETATSHGGAVYFDGLAQVNPDDLSDLLSETQDYVNELSELTEEGNPNIPAPELIDDSLVSGFLYVGLPYVPTDYEPEELDGDIILEELEEDLSGIGGSPEGEALAEETTEVLDEFLDSYDEYITYSGYKSTYTTQTFFLRSEYADLEGLEITKTYTDSTPPYLQTGDRVFFDISITNTSSVRKDNIAYVDRIPEYFSFAGTEFEILTEDGRKVDRKPGIGNFNILLDGLYLEPGEETIVRFELETLPLSYGHILVGLYEEGEVGDDEFGDIVIKDDNQNCGDEADIFRSTASRSYVEGTTVPLCDAADIDIGNTFPELTDTDGDGIPDYLQNLLEVNSDGDIVVTGDSGELLDYADQTLLDLHQDSDGDGIPDTDDSMDGTDSATDFMGALGAINGAIDEISAEIDELIQGLSCGFGGGSCFANPLNWAPLAPGNDPTLFGMPIGDGLRVNEGVPVFSALTGRQTSCGLSPCCLPSIYPMTSQTFIPGPFCGGPGAGGSLGVTSPTNFVRLFATPTLTGSAGIAVCFGAPAIAAGNANPMGVHPVVPGGNCIVAAMPLFGCEGDEGDPGVLTYPITGDFGIVNANCEGTGDRLYTPQEIEDAFVQDYLEYLQTGIRPPTLYDNYVSAFTEVVENGGGDFTLPSEPLINIGGGGDESMSVSVNLDTSALQSGNFQDIIQVQNQRIGGFPNFLMDWVDRQLDEITSKLTNLPKILVILPEFGGIFDYSWEDFGTGMQESFQDGRSENDSDRANHAAELQGLRDQRSTLDCSGDDRLRCTTIDLRIATLSGQNGLSGTSETLSGIKEVYEFIGNIPLVNVETETISVNVPWIDLTELERFSLDWEYTLEQWKDELEDAKNRWDITKDCSSESSPEAQESCEQEIEYAKLLSIEAGELISSLEQNIQILQEYKEFPQRLAKLINIKEVWLEQILCNIEAIATLMGAWINENGERFKAWVEVYLLVKAALESWQLLIDVFQDYEESCHECKNERNDLQNFVFQLVSAIIPSPPIIEFPKWPDIILDFHNIRAGMTIYMPDFEMNLRPIVLPDLPKLKLPDLPHASVNLPSLPLLPRFTIPELPELPSLPTIELPDLPPPPKIPKLFGAVEAILNIMKLVTKVMCILKQSPFVPEWRAGDQIAFITERNGYLPGMDFIDIQPPAFSYSAISAIKVTSYVNFEFEMDFIVEAVRSIVAPINDVTNNIVNMFDIQTSDIDLRGAIPSDFEINVETDGVEIEDISIAPLDQNPEGIYFIAHLIASQTQRLVSYLGNHSQDTLSHTEFKQYVLSQVASESVTSDPHTAKIQELWKEVASVTYSKEDRFIEELRHNSEGRFQTLMDIISTEIDYSQEQQQKLKNLGDPEYITQVRDTSDTSRVEQYSLLLEGYNIDTVEAALNLVNGESEESKRFREDIQEGGEKLMRDVRGSLSAYNGGNNLLADHVDGHSGSAVACSASQSDFTYEGIYVLEHGKNYRLFDYIDPLRGDEVPTIIDTDNDGDQDVLYMIGGKLYFKENRTDKPTTSHIPGPPLILDISDNDFYNGTPYLEAINGFAESNVSDGAINIEFQRPTDSRVNNFRMVYYTIVDKYRDESIDFIPESTQTHIVDAFAELDESPIVSSNSAYTLSNNIATLSYAGAMNGLKITTELLKDIREDMSENTQVSITAGTPIYAGSDSFRINYSSDGEDLELTVPAYSNVTFNEIIDISELSGSAYVSLGILQDIENTDAIDYIGMPILPGAKISYSGDGVGLSSSSHIDIRYYDGSEVAMDMREVDSYTLYDLGNSHLNDKEHNIRLNIPNDFYYARVQSFQGNIEGTWSKQILLAPQKFADTFPPQIALAQKIRIPVYQQQTVDLTPYIYEDGGLGGIAEVRVDFDLATDLDGDGDPTNDADTDGINIIRSPIKIEIEFGPYDTLFTRNINIALVDDNGNVGEKEVEFEVYPPVPEIQNVEENTITGQINETLLDEPVRLYRYRGGIVEKLQEADGSDLVSTNLEGDYGFETVETSSGLTLTHSGFTLAEIDEYTGKINLTHPLTSTEVIPTNSDENTSAYPETQILFGGDVVFRQYPRVPEGEVSIVNSLLGLDTPGIYLNLIDEANYSSYRIPLGVTYSPGSVTFFRASDPDKASIMTIFRDGRIQIDESSYRLIYRTLDDTASYVLINTNTGEDIAQVVYHMNASYILR